MGDPGSVGSAPGSGQSGRTDMANSSAAVRRRETLDRVEYGRRLRAVTYTRVSTEEQKKGYGIAAQDKKNLAYIDRKDWDHVGTFCDEGLSGSLEMGSREDYDRLMAEASRTPKPFDVVTVTNTDRIGRTERAFYRWVWALEDLGIFVALSIRDIDNTTKQGREAMRGEADYAFREYERIRERTQGGLQEKAESGGWTGGRPPMGWRIENRGVKKESRLALDDDDTKGSAWTLRRARELLVANGGNWSKAGGRLNEEKLFTRSGKPWSGDNLKLRMTSDAVLKGHVVFRNPNSRYVASGRGAKLTPDGRPEHGQTVIIPLEPIFTPDELEAFKRVLRKGPQRNRDDWSTYPLSRRIASLCGKHYNGNIQTATGLRRYRCTGKIPAYVGAPTCSCSEIDADTIEKYVWTGVTKLLGEPQKLEEFAQELVGLSTDGQPNHEARIEELDRQIKVQKKAHALVLSTTAVQAAREELTPEESQDLVTEATAPIGQEIARLTKEREEAIAWKQESAQVEERARDLKELARLARHELPNMATDDQDEVLRLLKVTVTVLSAVPVVKGRKPCSVAAWFKAKNLDIPLAVSDAQWALMEPLVKKSGRGTGKTTDLPLRDSVEAILFKARENAEWTQAAATMGHGVGKSLMSRWRRWSEGGVWEQLMEALADAEAVPAPEPSGFQLPDLRIEGTVDPRLLIEDLSVDAHTVASSTTIN
ncbi:recombinase family protein [Streptomyces sp. NBC_01579]|uniref:recombinase family protein n=1 Tax=Streptomyces sp. NBC_01579 TaxID=2975885 RepID=UPI0038693C5B